MPYCFSTHETRGQPVIRSMALLGAVAAFMPELAARIPLIQ
jgi:hypothetical protein